MPITPLQNDAEPTHAPTAVDGSSHSAGEAGGDGQQGALEDSAAPQKADAPLSFVPHGQGGSVGTGAPVKIAAGRYGELEEHELLHLLGSMEDERARGRFRESIYISFFLCSALAWLLLYGPLYLWHAPRLISPADVLKSRELVQLNSPIISPAIRSAAPKAIAKAMDSKTLERLRASAPRPTPPAPTPQPLPANAAPTVPPPNAPTPQPTPRPAPPVVADAPSPSAPAATRPNFSTPGNASDAMRGALHDATRGGAGAGGTTFSSRGGQVGGGVQVLSDMQGVDFTEYLNRLQRDVYRNWIPLLPEETQPPLMKQGETYIRFTILPGGEIGAMHLDGPSGDVAIDKAAWGSIIAEGQFPPLPAKFHGPDLELRFHYLVNKQLR